jgi:uncharacterized protein
MRNRTFNFRLPEAFAEDAAGAGDPPDAGDGAPPCAAFPAVPAVCAFNTPGTAATSVVAANCPKNARRECRGISDPPLMAFYRASIEKTFKFPTPRRRHNSKREFEMGTQFKMGTQLISPQLLMGTQLIFSKTRFGSMFTGHSRRTSIFSSKMGTQLISAFGLVVVHSPLSIIHCWHIRYTSPPMPAAGSSNPPRAFHVLTKPIGPICNLDCKYCFYLEKENLYPQTRSWAMPPPVLENYIRQYIQSQPGPEIHFAWQGGEPTLLGVEFFDNVVRLQLQYSQGKKIFNALQTNGTLLDDAWCEFFAEHQFLIGLSIDGPPELHDLHRVDKAGRKTFDSVMRGLKYLQKHQVDFNTLTVVNRANSQHPLEFYEFLKQIGSSFIQFIPLVERLAPAVQLSLHGLAFAEPPVAGENSPPSPVTEWSVQADQYGTFLCEIFDHWVRRDVGNVFVQIFDVALGNWMGLGSSLCVFAEKCGAAMAIEHNGDLYSCDHYVYPQHHLGNIMTTNLGDMATSPMQTKFGNDKLDTLPNYCKTCEVRFACNGECPKHRFIKTPDGEDGLNYLCAAYKKFFRHIDPYMRTMGELLRDGKPAGDIMEILRLEEAEEATEENES